MNADAKETCRANGVDDDCCLLVMNFLAKKARRRRLPASPEELPGLAGLAVARAAAYYDPDKATCPLREWLFSQGWRLLLSAVRDAARKTKQSVKTVVFTDLSLRRESADPCSRPGPDPRDPTDILKEFLDDLDQGAHGIILMRIGGRTLAEIARKYHVSIETVRQRLFQVGRWIEEQVARDR